MPEGVPAEDGSMAGFSNELVIRYPDRVIVENWVWKRNLKTG